MGELRPGGVGSWVVKDRRTGRGIVELFLVELVRKVNLERYEVVPVEEYLEEMNKRVRKGEVN